MFRGPQPMQTYANPPELGGLRANFTLDHPVNYGMSREMRVDWTQTVLMGENDGWPRFDGDVWSIQLTARPGHYVSPEILYEIGWDDAEGAPNA